jgi:ATP-binding cassette subfamily E protein 1
MIVNLPEQLKEDPIFRYGENSFALFRLSLPKPQKCLGIIASNGGGKTTVLKILQGQLPIVPRTTEMKAFFSSKKTVSYKPQEITSSVNIKDLPSNLLEKWQLSHLVDRSYDQLSGGEKQRAHIACCLSQKADLHIFDEPTVYLDVEQRVKLIEIPAVTETSIVVDHDIAILDYLSDSVSIIYGQSNVYGVVTAHQSTAEAVNSYLEGYLPTENVRFREWSLQWSVSQNLRDDHCPSLLKYLSSKIDNGSFTLEVSEGSIEQGITVILGRNGCGKSTFLQHLQSLTKTSLKPQLFPENTAKVRDYLSSVPTELVKDLQVSHLFDQILDRLSGGQRQMVEICRCLSTPADVYLLDEPSAGLDVESRFLLARVLKRFILDHHCSAVVVEHDLYLANYLADSVILVTGEPGVSGIVNVPGQVQEQLNLFLKSLNITVRRDHLTRRPRINKVGSTKDTEQKRSQKWYSVES